MEVVNVEEVRPKDTEEILRKHTNRKLVNQILFNKMSKNILNKKDAKNATAEVLSSFKSLTAMFQSVSSIIKYFFTWWTKKL